MMWGKPFGGNLHSGMGQVLPGGIIVAKASACWGSEGDVVGNFFYFVGSYGRV
jgi:hypothetical protein